MRNGRFLIIGGTVSEPYYSSNFFCPFVLLYPVFLLLLQP